ncbi:MAG: hypothetical protein IJF84_10575 [Thermoguttaceae bacterium]|nr:hypothetical protein [Thermoguttaceae bacterium]
MTDNNDLFDIFQFVQIPVTDDLAAVQKAVDALPVRKMAELQKNPGFSKIRSFIFTKTATPAYREYVQNIRDLRLKNKQHTNTKQQQNQTGTDRSRSKDVDTRSETERQKEWIRQYDERANKLNNQNGNNNTKVDSDVQDSNERNPLQRLADLLNQKPDRKTSRIFTIAWFLSTKSICEIVIICFMMAILSSLSEAGFGIALLVRFVFLLILGYAAYRLILPDVRALNLIKNGYFTLGRKDSNGDILYTDKNNTQHRWRPQSSIFFNESIYNEYLIAADGNNPNHIKVLSVSDCQTSNSDIKFIIPEWFMFLNLPVTFDLSKSEFSSNQRFLWLFLALIIFLFIVF